MNYELAKELKDAGFPNMVQATGIGRECWPMQVEKPEDERTVLIAPTLSELIEACTSGQGGNFALHQNRRGDEKQWCAWLINSTPSSTTPHNRAYDLKEYGPTPEEAIARLWLALNKK